MMRSLLRVPLALIPRQSVLTVLSGCNRGFRWVAGSHTHGCWIGWYEREIQDAIGRIIRPGMTVWDLGANAGFYTLAFARMVGPRGRVIAFEPSATNVNHLLTHVRINCCDNVIIHQSAVTAACGFTSFAVHGGSDAMSHVSSAPTGYLVATVSIDRVLAERPEWWPEVLKIDVEGAEEGVLAGAHALLASSRPPILVLSLHGLQQAQHCLRILQEHEYGVSGLRGEGIASADAAIAADTVIARPLAQLASRDSLTGSGLEGFHGGQVSEEARG